MTDEAKIAEAVPLARLCLEELQRIGGGNRYIAGPEISLADLFVAPPVAYLGTAPEGKELLAAHPALGK